MAEQASTSASVSAVALPLSLAVGQALTTIGTSPWIGRRQVKGSSTDRLILGPRTVDLVASLAVLSALVSILWCTVSLEILAGGLLLIVAPLTAYQRSRLGQLGTLREKQNELRTKANRLREEKNALQTTMKKLQLQLEDLDKVKDALRAVAGRSSTDTSRLIEIVNENAEIQARRNSALVNAVMQRILAAALAADRNHDFVIANNEVDHFVRRVSTLPGIVLDTDRLAAFTAAHPDGTPLVELADIARHLKDDDTGDEDRILRYDPQSILHRQHRRESNWVEI